MNQVKKKFKLYRFAQIFGPGLSAWLKCSLFAMAPLAGALRMDPLGKWYMILNLGGGILLAAGIVAFAVITIVRYEKRRITAGRFDRTAGSFNRFETFLELEKTDHPLKSGQEQDARGFFSKFRLPLTVPLAVIHLVLALMFSAGDVLLLDRAYGRTAAELQQQQAEKQAEEEQKNEAEKQKKLAAEKARLIITLPDESELRAKPLDELDWEGMGESPHGFTGLAMAVYVNSEFHSNIPPEKAPAAAGAVRFGSFLALEDLNVKPFDLVSYHLTARAMVGGEERTILSEPGFIEVRPFREDVFAPEGLDLDSNMVQAGLHALDILNSFLNIQIRLNKAAFALQIYLLNPTEENPVDTVKVRDGLAEQQRELAENVDKFLNDPEFRTLGADIVDSLEKALSDMKESAGQLGAASSAPAVGGACQCQQKAIANLIQAMRNIRKILLPRGSRNPQAGEKQEENPFKDKQKFKPPELDPEKNSHDRLQQLIEEQKKLNEEIKKGDNPGDLAQKQDRLQEKTAQMKNDTAGQDDAAAKLDQAAEAMGDASDNLRADKQSAALLKGQKAAANLESARKLIEKNSNETTRDALNETRKKLDKMADDLKNGKRSAEEAAKELSAMANELSQQAGQQAQQGTMGNAGKLGKLAENTARVAEANPDRKLPPDEQAAKMAAELEELKKAVNAMQMDGREPEQFLESALNELNEQQKHLKYAAGNPDEIPPEEAADVMADMKALLENMERALELLQEKSTNAETRAGAEEARKRIRNTSSTIPYAIPPDKAAAIYHDLAESARQAGILVTELLLGLKHDIRVYIFNSDDVPEKYRQATRDYFERLSAPEAKGGKK